MIVWVVGQWYREAEDGRQVWEMAGVFSTEEKAVAACRTANYFVGPLPVDTEFPHETVEWPDCYYPLADKGAGS